MAIGIEGDGGVADGAEGRSPELGDYDPALRRETTRKGEPYNSRITRLRRSLPLRSIGSRGPVRS